MQPMNGWAQWGLGVVALSLDLLVCGPWTVAQVTGLAFGEWSRGPCGQAGRPPAVGCDVGARGGCSGGLISGGSR